jgi:hypothetical protein
MFDIIFSFSHSKFLYMMLFEKNFLHQLYSVDVLFLFLRHFFGILIFCRIADTFFSFLLFFIHPTNANIYSSGKQLLHNSFFFNSASSIAV